MLPDGPAAEVCEIKDRETFMALTASGDFRWWAVEVIEGMRLLKKDHTDGKCAPGAPCEKCQRLAGWWWFEWAKRRAKREAAP